MFSCQTASSPIVALPILASYQLLAKAFFGYQVALHEHTYSARIFRRSTLDQRLEDDFRNVYNRRIHFLSRQIINARLLCTGIDGNHPKLLWEVLVHLLYRCVAEYAGLSSSTTSQTPLSIVLWCVKKRNPKAQVERSSQVSSVVLRLLTRASYWLSRCPLLCGSLHLVGSDLTCRDSSIFLCHKIPGVAQYFGTFSRSKFGPTVCSLRIREALSPHSSGVGLVKSSSTRKTKISTFWWLTDPSGAVLHAIPSQSPPEK